MQLDKTKRDGHWMNGMAFGQESSHVWPKKETKPLTVVRSKELKEKEMIAWEKNEIKNFPQKVHADDRLSASLLLDNVHAQTKLPHHQKKQFMLGGKDNGFMRD